LSFIIPLYLSQTYIFRLNKGIANNRKNNVFVFSPHGFPHIFITLHIVDAAMIPNPSHIDYLALVACLLPVSFGINWCGKHIHMSVIFFCLLFQKLVPCNNKIRIM